LTRVNARLLASVTAALALFAIAGCGSSSSSTSSTTASAAATTTPASTGGGGGGGTSSGGAASITSAKNADLGMDILVGANGMTVYDFEKDTSSQSNCSGACAGVWPPVTTTGAPKVGGDVDSSKLGTIKRDDGSTQVTYNGHPLYYYTADQKPGDATGNGIDEFGAEWYALQPSGDQAEGSGKS
jgi:predicted lipoprotein with Yx(FWY)xxD motif